jgi:hypothetical protein
MGIVVGGGGPQEPLHYVYAALAFALLPVAVNLSRRWSPRSRSLTVLIGVGATLVLLLRLLETG